MEKEYLSLEKLEVYQLARELSRISWEIYKKLSWQMQKVNGDQFIEATDSVGANIAEGYGRFHYLDKIKFYYNARGSLLESRHWLSLLEERKLLIKNHKEKYLHCYAKLRPKLNGLIKSGLKAKNPNY